MRFRFGVFFLLFCAVIMAASPAVAKRSKSKATSVQTTSATQKSPKKSKSASAKKSRAKSEPISADDPLRLRVRSALALDAESGTLLYEKDADKQIAPASLTKILTLYIVQEAIEQGKLSPDDQVRVSSRAANASGSVMDLYTGERVSVRELMKGISIASANDGCVAIAEHMAGDVDSFVRIMNRKARTLGMLRTTFKTPNGLPADGQVTTARDMAKLARAYLKRFPLALEMHATRNYFHNRRNHQNANRLLGEFEGADGLKTGFVNASGYNIIATAKRGDTRIIAVTLGSTSSGMKRTRRRASIASSRAASSVAGRGVAVAGAWNRWGLSHSSSSWSHEISAPVSPETNRKTAMNRPNQRWAMTSRRRMAALLFNRSR